jgi:adenine deaminase
VTAEDFAARPPESAINRSAPPVGAEGETVCVAMRVEPGSTFTAYGRFPCAVRDGVAEWRSAGLCLIASVERYGKRSPVRLGFVSGTLSAPGAVATTWAHDSHNILVMGTSVDDMVAAVNELIAMQGGYIVYGSGKPLARASLPVGGIVSDGPYEVLAAEIRAVRAAMRSLGYVHADEIMSFSTLSLLVSPSLKISDKGLIDVRTQEFVESYELPHP